MCPIHCSTYDRDKIRWSIWDPPPSGWGFPAFIMSIFVGSGLHSRGRPEGGTAFPRPERIAGTDVPRRGGTEATFACNSESPGNSREFSVCKLGVRAVDASRLACRCPAGRFLSIRSSADKINPTAIQQTAYRRASA